MRNHVGYIEVCYIEDPFICKIWGDFTLEQLSKIEKSLTENEYGFNEKYKGIDIVKFSVNHIGQEIQYGTGYGDVYNIPSYYDLVPVSSLTRNRTTDH